MSNTPTLEEVLGTARSADDPHLHLNHEGAVVAVTFTPEGWAAVDPLRKSEHQGQRSVITRCPVRGVVSVDAYVVPAVSALAPKPWSRAERAAYAFLEAA
ncbi:MAG: hypothetical protein REI11_10960 [Patulibacter sp.]|nr:hypothetical protein [Patulibacter sp.]